MPVWVTIPAGRREAERLGGVIELAQRDARP